MPRGKLEHAATIDGELTVDLAQIQPLARQQLETIVGRFGAPRPAFVDRWLATPWRRTEGTRTHYKRMVALAREAIRMFGETHGLPMFEKWLDRIEVISPELSGPSERNQDPRNVLIRGRNSAWAVAVQHPTSWVPLSLNGRRPGVARLYRMLAAFVQRNGLRSYAFALDFENIANELDCAKSTAFELVQRAERAGLLVRHDRGCPDEKRRRGKATLYGLVGDGETAEAVLERGAHDRLVQERFRLRVSESTDR